MKNTILSLFFACVLSASIAQVVSYEFIQTYSTSDLQQIVNNFGAGGAIVPQYEVDLYRVHYRTEYHDSTTIVTGALAIPQNTVCKPPLISYQHGTSSSKLGVPSYGSTELQICLVFAAEGNVLVAPDYIGLGGSTIDIHPYQHAFSQGHSTINLLRATRELQDDLSFELSNQLFLFGYSQGGHATMSAVKYIEQLYSNEFTITAAMPMSGAYDMSGSQTDFINDNPSYATPGYLPYIILGYQSIYENLYDSLSQIFISPYDSTMPYYFYGHNYGIGFINGQCPSYPPDMFTQSARDEFFNNPNFPFVVHLKDNDLLDFAPQTKVRLYYCTGDEQVYYQNSIVADSLYNYNGAPDAEAVFLTNEDHGGCVDDALISARLFFGSLLNNGIEILVDYNESTNTASISVLNDDLTNYDIEWNDGSTGSTINGLNEFGTYEVTLTDKVTGCSQSKRFGLDDVTSIRNRANEFNLNVYPNPSNDYIILSIDAKQNESFVITDVLGNVINEFVYVPHTEPLINVRYLSAGTYWIHLKSNPNAKISFVKK